MTPPLHAHQTDPAEAHQLARALARPVALGYLDPAHAHAAIALAVARHAPQHLNPSDAVTRALWTLNDAIRRWRREREHAESRIRRVIWPLCRDHAPGRTIFAAAQRANTGAFAPSEIPTLCIAIASQATTPRRRRRVH